MSNKARLKPVYSATETSYRNEGSGTIKLSDIFDYLRELKPAMQAIYSEIVTRGDSSSKCHQSKNNFSFAQSENFFKEYYDSDENELTCTQKKEQTLST